MTLLVVHLVLTAAYAGFQWTVRVLVRSPGPAAAFATYERSHQRRVTRVVGPPFAGQGGTTVALLAARPARTPLLPVLAGAACLAVVLGVTAARRPAAPPPGPRLGRRRPPPATAGGHRPGGSRDRGHGCRGVGAVRRVSAHPA